MEAFHQTSGPGWERGGPMAVTTAHACRESQANAADWVSVAKLPPWWRLGFEVLSLGLGDEAVPARRHWSGMRNVPVCWLRLAATVAVTGWASSPHDGQARSAISMAMSRGTQVKGVVGQLPHRLRRGLLPIGARPTLPR